MCPRIHAGMHTSLRVHVRTCAYLVWSCRLAAKCSSVDSTAVVEVLAAILAMVQQPARGEDEAT